MAWGESSTSGRSAVDHARAQPQEQDRQLLAEVAGQQDHRVGGRPPGRWWPEAGRPTTSRGEAVAQLGVDRVRADDPLGQLGPGVGTLVGQPGAADDPDRFGSADPIEASSRPAATAASASCHEAGTSITVLADQRLGQAVLTVDRLEGEPTLVAQPPVVDRVGVDAEQPGHPVGRRLHGHPAPHGARGARRLDLVEVPRAGRRTGRGSR